MKQERNGKIGNVRMSKVGIGTMWNPWHGCRKYSEGCDNCYMFYQDRQREQDGSNIYKVKTNFNLPLKKDRQGNFKIKSGEQVRVCMTSDFFLEESDAWRDEVWDMIRIRSDVYFWLYEVRLVTLGFLVG